MDINKTCESQYVHHSDSQAASYLHLPTPNFQSNKGQTPFVTLLIVKVVASLYFHSFKLKLIIVDNWEETMARSWDFDSATKLASI
jgi:hypothetical protein